MKKSYNYLRITFLAVLMSTFVGLQAQLNVLLVNDNDVAPDRLLVIEEAIANTGYPYITWDITTNGAAPSLEMMQAFNLVIWYTSKDNYGLTLWNGDDTDNEDIKAYIDNGGMFWLTGLDFLKDRYPHDQLPVDFTEGDFVYDYLGVSNYYAESHMDDGVWSDGVPELDLVDGTTMFTINPMLWTYSTMWYADALLPTDNATAIYQMGPVGYDFDQYYTAIYNEKGDGKVLIMATETAKLDSQDNIDLLFQEGCDYFNQYATAPEVMATSVEITAEGDATEITENFAALQLTANLLPEDVSVPFVYWSYEGDINVSLTQNGLLHASGTESGNGTVTVKATTIDGSNLVATYEVTISNQGTVPNVLLVNDNLNGTTRWQVLDAALTNLGTVYNVHNMVSEQEIPTYDKLKEYDMIIWYTGNDGASLNLWEFEDDTLNTLKFNAPLMQYLDNGDGVVWLQGLDFMYDIFNGAPDWFTEGTFMYDYMGIDTYAVQSHVDGGGQNLTEMTAVAGNSVASTPSVTWTYTEGMWYADGFTPTSNAEKVYKMQPAPLDDFYCGIYNVHGNSKIFTLAVETARIDTQENTDAFFGDVLEHFGFPNSVEKNISTSFDMAQNIPNPTNGQTTIPYTLTKKSNVELSIMNIMGQVVLQRKVGTQEKGNHQMEINVENLSSGIYTYTLTVDGQNVTRKMIVQ